MKNAGFTLLEVLAAVMIFAIMAASISMTVSETTKLTKKVKVRESTVMSSQIAFDRLQSDLQMAFNENMRNSPSIFKGVDSTHGMELVFSMIDNSFKVLFQSRTPGIILVRYHLDRAEDGTLTLYRSETPFYKSADYLQSQSHVVAKGLLGLEFEFYDFKNDLWQKKWDTTDAQSASYFPRAVKMKLTVSNPDLSDVERKEKAVTLSTAFQILNEIEARQ